MTSIVLIITALLVSIHLIIALKDEFSLFQAPPMSEKVSIETSLRLLEPELDQSLSSSTNYLWGDIVSDGSGKNLLALETTKPQVFISNDYGQTWSVPNSLPDSVHWKKLFIDPTGQYFIVNGINPSSLDNEIYYSNDFGFTWELSNWNTEKVENECRTGLWSMIKSNQEASLIIVASSCGLITSTNHGASWDKSYSLDVVGGITTVAIDYTGENIIATSIIGDIYISNDYGRKFILKSISKDFIHWGDLISCPSTYFSSSSSFHSIFIATAPKDGIYLSSDNGHHWKKLLDKPLEWKGILCKNLGERIIAYDNKGIIFSSTDHGENWKGSKSLNYEYISLTSDSQLNRLIGTAKDVESEESEIILSVNHGETWSYIERFYEEEVEKNHNNILQENLNKGTTSMKNIINNHENKKSKTMMTNIQSLFSVAGGANKITSLFTLGSGNDNFVALQEVTTTPTESPTTEPSSRPSIMPTAIPSVGPTQRPANHPTSQPTSYPSVVPKASPTSKPTQKPHAFPTSQPSSQPSSRPTENLNPPLVTLAPNISYVQFSSSSSTGGIANIVVSVGINPPYTSLMSVYCAAFQTFTLSMPTTNDIINQGVSKFITTNPISLTIPNLIPVTNYTVLCTTVLADGKTTLPLLSSYLKAITAQTSCCKVISLTLARQSVTEFTNSVNGLTLSISSLPTQSITVSVVLTPMGNTTSIIATMIFPSSFTFTSGVATTSAVSTIIGGSAQNYRFSLVISGSSQREYAAADAVSSTVLTLLSASAEPATPALQTAVFSSDGSYLILSFNGSTNMNGYSNSFPCSALLSFTGISFSTCTWRDSSSILIYQSTSTNQLLEVGSSIVLKSVSTFKAQCSASNSAACSNWMSIKGKTVLVAAPSTVSSPSVQISAPTLLAPCQSFTLDLTSSTGSAGRTWKTMNVVARQSPKISSVTELNNFLSTNYTFSPAGVVPASLLTRGANYVFQVTLCNFLTACDTKTAAVSILQNETVLPLLSIAGSSSLSLARSVPLSIKANAFTQSCTGAISFSGLRYVWAISVLSGNVSTNTLTKIVSTSQNPAIYALSAYTLPTRSVYQITVTVTSVASLRSSTASVTVSVLQGNIIPVLTGGSSRVIQTNVLTTIDASGSYDQDKIGLTGSKAGLSFLWSCYQLSPVFAANCSNTLTISGTTTSEKLKVISASDLAINTTSQVTVTVFDATRSVSASTQVFITSKAVNAITITTSPQTLTSVLTTNTLSLTAALDIVSPCTATWAVNDTTISLSQISATTTSQRMSGGKSIPFNLLLLSNTLPQRAGFQFTLSCGLGSASIQVATNGAPVPGVYTLSPTEGNELSTSFSLVASSWSDPDLPLSYQFGFISPATGSSLVVLARSPTASAFTTLPAGSAVSQNKVTCSLQVFDVFGANVFSYGQVSVKVLSAEAQQQQISALLSSSSSGSVDSQKSMLSVVSSVINRINCTVPVNCTSLNRAACSKTPNTCGSCASGFTGDSGDRNTKCFSLTSLSSAPEVTDCLIDSDCLNPLKICSTSKLCVFAPKSCPQNCSGNGVCQYKSVSTGVAVTDCRVNDVNCRVSCLCNTGFSGSSCSMTQADLEAAQAVRSALVNTLANLTQSDDVSADTVASWSSFLSAVTSNPDEVSPNDVSKIQNIALTTMNAANSLGLDSSQVSGVLSAVDGTTSISSTSSRRRLTSSSSANSAASSLMNILTQFSNVNAKSQVYGLPDSYFIYDNFRVTATAALLSSSSNFSIAVAETDVEKLFNQPKSSVIFIPNSNSNFTQNTLTVSLVQTFKSTYSTTSANDFYSNPIRLILESSNIPSSIYSDGNAVFSGMLITLQHNVPVPTSDFIGSELEVFNTTCTKGVIKTEVYNCSIANVQLKNECNGTFSGLITSNCPKIEPVCSNLNISAASLGLVANPCQVVNYTASASICYCEFSSIPSGRRLSSSSSVFGDSGQADLVAANSMSLNPGRVTIDRNPFLFDSSSSSKSYVTTILISCVWGAVILLTLIMYFFDRIHFAGTMGRANAYTVSDSNNNDNFKEHFTAYLRAIIPSIYQSEIPFYQRILQELTSQHHYLSLFHATRSRKAQIGNARLYGMLQIASILTMPIFLILIFLDAQNPKDDDSCSQHYNLNDCLSDKRMFDRSQSYCDWNSSTNQCTYSEVDFSEVAVIYIMVITTFITAVWKVLADILIALSKSIDNADDIIPIQQVSTHAHLHKTDQILPYRAESFTALDSTFNKQQQNQPIEPESSSFAFLPLLPQGRVIPESIIIARSELETSYNQIMENIAEQRKLKKSNSEEEGVTTLALTKGSLEKTLAEILETNEDGVTTTTGNPLTTARGESVSPEELLQKFEQQLISYRKSLVPYIEEDGESKPMNNVKLCQFDDQWGVDALALRAIQTARPTENPDQFFKNHVHERYSALIHDIQPVIRRKKAMLTQATGLSSSSNGAMTSAGIELFSTFFVDLLGLNTTASTLFQGKFNTLFPFAFVDIPILAKISALAALIAVDVICVFFLIHRSIKHEYNWQIQALYIILVQLALEVLIFETIEVAWIHYIIPSTIKEEVQKMMQVLYLLVSKFDLFMLLRAFKEYDHTSGSDGVRPASSSSFSSTSFDMTEFLFISKALATTETVQLSLSLETMMIVPYHNYYPGMIVKTWPHYINLPREVETRNELGDHIDGVASPSAQRYAVWGDSNRMNSVSRLHSTRSPIPFIGPVFDFITLIMKRINQWIGCRSLTVQQIIVRFISLSILSAMTIFYYHSRTYDSCLGLFIALGSVVVALTFIYSITPFHDETDDVILFPEEEVVELENLSKRFNSDSFHLGSSQYPFSGNDEERETRFTGEAGFQREESVRMNKVDASSKDHEEPHTAHGIQINVKHHHHQPKHSHHSHTKKDKDIDLEQPIHLAKKSKPHRKGESESSGSGREEGDTVILPDPRTIAAATERGTEHLSIQTHIKEHDIRKQEDSPASTQHNRKPSDQNLLGSLSRRQSGNSRASLEHAMGSPAAPKNDRRGSGDSEKPISNDGRDIHHDESEMRHKKHHKGEKKKNRTVEPRQQLHMHDDHQFLNAIDSLVYDSHVDQPSVTPPIHYNAPQPSRFTFDTADAKSSPDSPPLVTSQPGATHGRIRLAPLSPTLTPLPRVGSNATNSPPLLLSSNVSRVNSGPGSAEPGVVMTPASSLSQAYLLQRSHSRAPGGSHGTSPATNNSNTSNRPKHDSNTELEL